MFESIRVPPWVFYTTYISVDLEHREIFRAKVGKGGIMIGGTVFSHRLIILYALKHF